VWEQLAQHSLLAHQQSSRLHSIPREKGGVVNPKRERGGREEGGGGRDMGREIRRGERGRGGRDRGKEGGGEEVGSE
jgi:hypothetical protein